MSQRSLSHGSFVVERHYPAPPSRVFRAFAELEEKARWFACTDEWDVMEHRLDFRVGGHEVVRVGPPGGVVHRNDTTYHDIVPDERIVWSYAMRLDDRRISVSLASVELRPEGGGTRLVLTEHGMFLDGYDGEEDRERGTRVGLENLARYLEGRVPAEA